MLGSHFGSIQNGRNPPVWNHWVRLEVTPGLTDEANWIGIKLWHNRGVVWGLRKMWKEWWWWQWWKWLMRSRGSDERRTQSSCKPESLVLWSKLWLWGSTSTVIVHGVLAECWGSFWCPAIDALSGLVIFPAQSPDSPQDKRQSLRSTSQWLYTQEAPSLPSLIIIKVMTR